VVIHINPDDGYLSEKLVSAQLPKADQGDSTHLFAMKTSNLEKLLV
jgi:hypothetical protein